jgi:hypothetical protein
LHYEILEFLLSLWENKNNSTMLITINRTSGIQQADKLLSKLKPQKTFSAQRFLGKMQWGEDALQYQKKLRDEWN